MVTGMGGNIMNIARQQARGRQLLVVVTPVLHCCTSFTFKLQHSHTELLPLRGLRQLTFHGYSEVEWMATHQDEMFTKQGEQGTPWAVAVLSA